MSPRPVARRAAFGELVGDLVRARELQADERHGNGRIEPAVERDVREHDERVGLMVELSVPVAPASCRPRSSPSAAIRP